MDWSNLQNLDFSSALDVFGGTGSVSYLLKRMGKEVTYNDYLRFNHHIGMAIIENDDTLLNQRDIDAILKPSPRTARHFVRDTFKGVYFTDEENTWIDNAVDQIRNIKAEPSILIYKQSLLYYGLFQSCLIKRPFNLFHRQQFAPEVSKREAGVWKQNHLDRDFNGLFAKFCLEASRSVFKGTRPCKAICCDALEISNTNHDLVYVDPPYFRKDARTETMDYLKSYHFLEGICAYDCWSDLLTMGLVTFG